MNDQITPTTGKTPKPLNAPVIPTGDDLFHEIMGPIEPDLLLAEAEREAKYVGESEAEHTARVARYADAITEYKKQYEEKQIVQSSDIRSFGNNLLHDFESQDSVKESLELDLLASQIAKL